MSGDNELFIYLKMVADQATQTSVRYHQGERQRIDRTARDQAKADADYIKAVKLKERAVRDFARELESRDRATKRTEEQSNAEYIRAIKRKAAAEAQIHRETVRQKERDDAAYIRAVKANLAAQIALEKEAEAGTKAMAGAMTGYIAGFASFGTVLVGIKAASDYFAAIRRDTIESVKEMRQFREAVMELAAMKNQMGQTTPETVNQMQFRAKTVQSQAAALAMTQAAEGAGQAAVGANLTRSAFDEGLIMAGKIQAMEGSSPQGAGDLYGTYALEAAKGTTGKQLGERYAKGFKIQQPGRFANMAEFAAQRSQVSGYVQTGAMTGAEADVLVSGASLTNKAEAGTMVRQMMTAASADFMRARKMKLLPGMEHETSAEYMRDIGITEQMSPMQRLLAVGQDINKQAAEAKAKGQNFFGNDYLIKHGVMNEESRKGYMAMAALQQQGQWQNTFQPLLTKEVDTKDVEAQHRAFTTTDQVGKDRMAEMAQAAQIAKRSVSPVGQLEAIQKQEFYRLKGEGKITGTFEEWQSRGPLQKLSDDLLFRSWHSQVDVAVQNRLFDAAGKAGIKPGFDNNLRYGMLPEEILWNKASEEQLAGLSRQLEGAGINPLDASAKALLEAAQLLKDAAVAGQGRNMQAPGPPVKNPPMPLPPAAKAFQARIAASDAPWF